MTIPTPLYATLTSDDFDKVYEPAEDTFLLIDAIEKDIDTIKNNVRYEIEKQHLLSFLYSDCESGDKKINFKLVVYVSYISFFIQLINPSHCQKLK